jgi:hypothetical protein
MDMDNAGPSLTSRGLPRGDFWAAVQAAEGQPYNWGNAGPGSATIERISAMVPVSSEQLADMLPAIDFAEMWRQDAIHRRAMRRLKLADPAGYDRLQRLLRLAAAARADREDREHEARRCPTCGCDPVRDHDGDW